MGPTEAGYHALPYRHDSRTGEIVLRWKYYCSEIEEDVWFSRRFPARDYVTDTQLRRDYRLSPAQRNALGSSDEMWSGHDAWGYSRAVYWWKRARVEAMLAEASGYQPTLF
jgi:hypothetical protein